MSERRPLEGIFKGRGIKEFWEGAPKQESLLEWLGPPPDMNDPKVMEAFAEIIRGVVKGEKELYKKKRNETTT